MKIGNIGYRSTWAEINLHSLVHNFRSIKRLLSGQKVMVCVKADAYGHGIAAVSKKLVTCGVDYLGVASIDEGMRLRKEGIRAPILVLGLVLKENIKPLLTYDLTATVCTQDFAAALNKKAKALKRRAKVHIKVDTGMGRIGVLYKDAAALIKKVHSMRYLETEGLFTHLACADINQKFTRLQLSLFERLIAALEKDGIRIPLVHAANSMGAISYRGSHFNMVRPGLSIYGIYPKRGLPLSLKPVLSLKTRVIFVKRVPKGSGISYGHTYITRKSATIVTLPIGYGDGYPRDLSNLGPVLIKGRRYRISGRVCMDQMMVDVGNAPVKVGEEAVLIGSQGSGRISAEELAGLCATIPYEIVCGLGSRIPRVYL